MPGPLSYPAGWTDVRRARVWSSDRSRTGKTDWDYRSGKHARHLRNRDENANKQAGRR
jgi:hypothetical protein